MQAAPPAKAPGPRFLPEQTAYLQQKFDELQGRLDSETTDMICSKARLKKRQVSDWFYRARLKRQKDTLAAPHAAQQIRQPLLEVPQNMQQQSHMHHPPSVQQQQQQHQHALPHSGASLLDSMSIAGPGPARAANHQHQAARLQSLSQPLTFRQWVQRNNLASPSQQPIIPPGWEETEWTQFVSDVQCVLNGAVLGEENFEEIKELLEV